MIDDAREAVVQYPQLHHRAEQQKRRRNRQADDVADVAEQGSHGRVRK